MVRFWKPRRKRWEYRVFYSNPFDPIITSQLGLIGQDGWELVATSPTESNGQTALIFKREV